MKIKLFIRDAEYGRILAETIGEIGKDMIVEIGGSWEGDVDDTIVLTDIERCADIGMNNVVILTANPDDRLPEDYSGGPVRLFKYKSLTSILSDIEHVHYVSSGYKDKSYGILARVFAVCTDSNDKNNMLATSLARQILFRRGGDILIVSMGYINNYPCLDESNRSKFSRWMYYMDTDRAYSIDYFTYTDSYGISYLKLPRGFNPMAYMSVKEASEVIGELCEKKFETVILDIGSCYSELNVRMINKADNIVYIYEDENRMNIHDVLVEPNIDERLWELGIKKGDKDIEMLMDGYVRKVYGDEEEGGADEQEKHS